MLGAILTLGAMLMFTPGVAANFDDEMCHSRPECINYPRPEPEAASKEAETGPVTRRLASFNGATAEALVAALTGGSEDLVTSNIVLDCPVGSYGLVSYGGGGHAFEAFITGDQENVVLSSGDAAVAADPENNFAGSSTSTGGGSDADLTDAIGVSTEDACILQFDFEVPLGSPAGVLQYNYMFMSEEYNEFVDDFNDGFLLLIDGENVAKIPGTQDIVSIYTVNLDSNSALFNNNGEEIPAFNTEYDGFTALLSTAPVDLVPGQSYAVKLVIADALDSELDSSLVIEGLTFNPNVLDDPHMTGLLGQKIDWIGEDGAWYNLVMDPAFTMNARVTAPMSAEFPDRQLITGLALIFTNEDGGTEQSVVFEIVDPYSTAAAGSSQGLLGGAMRVLVDGIDSSSLISPNEGTHLPGQVFVATANLPAACQPFGGDIIWAQQFADITARRRLRSESRMSFLDWVKSWSETTAAPLWCNKFIDEEGFSIFQQDPPHDHCNHVVFRIETPSFAARLHVGTNHQGGEVIPDGRTLPELEFWQMDLHLEWAAVDHAKVEGILGGTVRPVVDADGKLVMRGLDAIRGNIEDYRVSSPTSLDFPYLNLV